MKKSFALFLLACICLAFQVQAQDTLVTHSEKIACKVSKVAEENIEYKKWNNLEGPLYVISKNQVVYIRFSNGTVENISTTPNTASAVASGRQAIKADFFAPASHRITLGYEYLFNRDLGVEVYGSYLSYKIFNKASNYNYSPHVQGAGVRVSPKLRLCDLGGPNRGNAFNIFFLRFDLLYSRMVVTNALMYPEVNEIPQGPRQFGSLNYNVYGLCMNIGIEFVVGKRVLVQFNGGAGYSAHSSSFKAKSIPTSNNYYFYYNNTYDALNPYGGVVNASNNPFCLTGNLTIGYILGKTTWKTGPKQ